MKELAGIVSSRSTPANVAEVRLTGELLDGVC